MVHGLDHEGNDATHVAGTMLDQVSTTCRASSRIVGNGRVLRRYTSGGFHRRRLWVFISDRGQFTSGMLRRRFLRRGGWRIRTVHRIAVPSR